MNFAELRFWEYLLAGVVVLLSLRWGIIRVFTVPTEKLDKVLLLTLGLMLLLCVNWITFVVFLAVAVGTYGGLGWIQRYHSQYATRYLLVLIPLQMAPLVFWKYANFLGNGILGLNVELLKTLIIPVGISFYTFQKVAFVVDTLAFKQPLPKFMDYMNFAGFFPQIVAGPIERRADLLPQMERFRFRWLPDQINEGVVWIGLGFFFKCCLADNLVSQFTAGSGLNAYLIWLDNIQFGLRIYYDFAGYSMIALGLAQCLGIKLTLNFCSPYCSTSVTEFWRRWHITLSQWFRDYIYVPLGGGRVRTWALNVSLVFVVSGIWHGAGWNFVCWGALHAIFLCVNRLGSKFAPPRFFSWALCMVATFYAWLCFYETDSCKLFAKMGTLLRPSAYQTSALREAIAMAGSTPTGVVITCSVLGLAAATLAAEWLSISRKNEPYHYLRKPAVLIFLIAFTIWLAPERNNGFIYFAF